MSESTQGGERLSDDAQKLLNLLRDRCRHRSEAKTDKQLALCLGVNPRAIIDLADELLVHGHVAVAETGSPPGRWVLCDDASDEEVALASQYMTKLDGRGKSILMRAKHGRIALRGFEWRRRRGIDGQQYLFGTAEAKEHASEAFATALGTGMW